MTHPTEEKKPEAEKPPLPSPALPTPEATPSQSITPVPSTPVPSAPEAKPKPTAEEKVKKARALLDQTIIQISKRENIPRDLVRMELYLENRMRKVILPKIDRLQSDVREIQHGIGTIGSLLLKNGNQNASSEIGTTSSDVGMQEEYPDVVEPVIEKVVQSIAAAPPSPPPFDEVAHQNDPLFGAMFLYLVGGSD